MDIALLNQRVTFQLRRIEADGIGNQIENWSDHYSCAATISGEGGQEALAAGAERDKPSLNVTVRWCSQIADANSTDYRLLFGGEAYDIEKIDHLSYKKRAIKFYCVKER